MKGIMRLVLASAVVAVAAVAGSAQPAKAGLLTCGTSAEKPFAAWGDSANYTLAPNGSLEYGSYGWSLSGGARVIPSNNALRPGKYSLSLPSGALALSPAACVKLADPASRFFLRAPAGTGKLRVDIQYKTLLGLFTTTSNLGYATAGQNWQPGPKYSHVLANILGALALNNNLLSASIRFKFTAVSGSFEVDDLFVDPLVQV
jgi:hypothetical protein